MSLDLSLDTMPDYVLKDILSYLGPCASFAETSRYLNETHKQAVSEMGMQLARVVDRSLWRTDVLPQEDATISQEQGVKIQMAALKKVKATLKHLSKAERKEFKHLSPARISTLPELVNKILLIAKRTDREQMVAMFRYQLPWSNKQKTLSELFAKITEYNNLGLSTPYIEELPDAIEDLSSLTSLTISDNKLESLPDTFGRLTALTYLSLINNNLESLPDSFGNLTLLFRIWLSSNRLASLPESIGNLASLTHLNIDHNQLRTLPESMEISPLSLILISETTSYGPGGNCAACFFAFGKEAVRFSVTL